MTIRSNPTRRWEPRLRYRSSKALLRRFKRLAMGAILFSAVLSIATSVALSQGAQGTPEQREACTLDAVNLCGTVIPDARRVEGCLLQHIAIVSLRCRAVIEKGRRSDRTSVSGSPHKSNWQGSHPASRQRNLRNERRDDADHRRHNITPKKCERRCLTRVKRSKPSATSRTS
jgi:hypothetical protein